MPEAQWSLDLSLRRFSVAPQLFLLALGLILAVFLAKRPAAPVLPGPAAYVPEVSSLPLQFELNAGQAESGVHYLAQVPGYRLYLASDKAVVVLPATEERPLQQLALHFEGAEPSPEVVGQDKMPGVVNYYLGRDPEEWHTGVPTFGGVMYRGLYPGIDLLFYGNEDRIEHDFIVAPGADPGLISVRVQGAESLAIDGRGNLVLPSEWGTLDLVKPIIYQTIGDTTRTVDGSYVLRGDDTFGFQLGAYDPEYSLVIDPILELSSYFGGSDNDYGNDITVDTSGNIYLTGYTTSTDFPVLNAQQPGAGGDGSVNCPSDVTPYRACYDAFVTKLNPSATSLLYSTYVGLPGDDEGHGIAVDTAGNAYITGLMSAPSPSLPDFYTYKQVLVVKLNSNGGLVYGGWFGSTGSFGNAIAVDAQGRAHITGQAANGFPTTPDAIQPNNLEVIDGFVVVLNPAGNQLEYSTYLGGSDQYCDVCYSAGKDIVLDSSGNIYVTGQAAPSFPTTSNAFQRTFDGFWKAFVTKINRFQPGPAGLVYSTLLGGSGSDFGESITLDAAGKVYITGSTQSENFPVTAGAFDSTCGSDGICNALNNQVCDWTPPGKPPICHLDSKADFFVAKLDLSKSGAASLVYATYIGGSGKETAYGIAVDTAGNAYVTGYTVSPDFPMASAIQPTIGGNQDVVVLKLNPTGSALSFSTFMGGGGDDMGKGVALNTAGKLMVTGYTGSMAFPVANPIQGRAGGWEAFISRLAIPTTGTTPTPVPVPVPDPTLDNHNYLPMIVR